MLKELELIGYISVKRLTGQTKQGKPRKANIINIKIDKILQNLEMNGYNTENYFIRMENVNINIHKSNLHIKKRKENPIGRKYHLLTVRYVNNDGTLTVECCCDKKFKTTLKELASGNLRNCGCINKEYNKEYYLYKNVSEIIRKNEKRKSTLQDFIQAGEKFNKIEKVLLDYCNIDEDGYIK